MGLSQLPRPKGRAILAAFMMSEEEWKAERERIRKLQEAHFKEI